MSNFFLLVLSFKKKSGDIAGHPASPGKAVGRALVVTTPEEAIHAIAGIADPTNLVLVTSTTDPAWTPIFMKVIGIVVEHGGLLSHGAITAREMGLPAVVGVGPNIKSITNGANIIVEGSTGKVVLPGQPIP
jgi:pyruvate,water dikinase